MTSRFGGVPVESTGQSKFGGVAVQADPKKAKRDKILSDNSDLFTFSVDELRQRDTDRRKAELEEIRRVNPILAEEIEATGPFKAAAIGTGRSLTNIARGVGLAEPEDEQEKASLEALGSQRPSFGAGEFVGDTVPFAAVGGPLSALAKTGVGQVLAGATLGGAEEAITTAGRGEGNPLVAGTIGAVTGGVMGRLFNYRRLTRKQQEIAEELQRSPSNPDFAKFVTEDGRPQVSARLNRAVKAIGGREGNEIVAVSKNASRLDKRAIKKMANTIRRGMADPVFRDANRAGDVVGDTLRERVVAVNKVKKEAGKRIDSIARNNLTGKKVDLTQARESFRSALEDLRVSYDPVKGKVKFADSALEGAGGGQARDITRRVSRMLSKENIDAADAHFIKRLIDQQTSFGKTSEGLAGEIDRAVKGLRRDINKSIRSVSKPYKKANIKYSESIDAINNLQDAAGTKVNMDSPSALGVALRRLTSNTQSRANLAESIQQIEDVAAKYGSSFDDSIATQINIANALEKRFKTQGSTTFTAGVGDGVLNAIGKSNLQRGIDTAKSVAQKVTSSTDEEALDALIDILD